MVDSYVEIRESHSPRLHDFVCPNGFGHIRFHVDRQTLQANEQFQLPLLNPFCIHLKGHIHVQKDGEHVQFVHCCPLHNAW